MYFLDLLSSMSSTRTVEPRAITNARRLYYSCIDEAAIELEDTVVIDSMLNKEFGGRPPYSNLTSNESPFDLYSTLLKVNQYNEFPLYDVSTTIDYDLTGKMKRCIQVNIRSEIYIKDRIK